MSIIAPSNSMQKTVKSDLDKIKADRDWISQNKNTASKEDIASHVATAEKDWEKFTSDSAGLQQSGDLDDKQTALDAYKDASKTFQSTQADYKEVLGGRENSDLANGDASAKSTQSSLSSLIDQGNAMTLHAQQLINENPGPGVNNGQVAYVDDAHPVGQDGKPIDAALQGGPVAGGTASPDAVSATSRGIFAANEAAGHVNSHRAIVNLGQNGTL